MFARSKLSWAASSVAVAVAVAAVVACGFGEVIPGDYDSSTGCPDGCPTGMACREGECVPPDGSCDGMVCPSGMTCEAGLCVAGNLCEDVRCDNPGEVCSGGVCIPGDADTDHDGYVAAEDCDDTNPAIHPGAEETCNGRDDDCDDEVDDGHDRDDDGYTSCGTGAPGTADCDDTAASVHPGVAESCNGRDDDCDDAVDEDIDDRSCSTACGSGVERCEGGEWVCSAPETCECSPAGREEDQDCGRCGTRTRACEDDLTWSDWGACLGDTDCPVVCGDRLCEGAEDCASCAADCGACPTCPATDHMGRGENDDPCTDPPEMWRCVFSDHWGDWISQVCRGGVWVTYHINPRDCEACCEDYSSACSAY